jgi:hypothetical protein
VRAERERERIPGDPESAGLPAGNTGPSFPSRVGSGRARHKSAGPRRSQPLSLVRLEQPAGRAGRGVVRVTTCQGYPCIWVSESPYGPPTRTLQPAGRCQRRCRCRGSAADSDTAGEAAGASAAPATCAAAAAARTPARAEELGYATGCQWPGRRAASAAAAALAWPIMIATSVTHCKGPLIMTRMARDLPGWYVESNDHGVMPTAAALGAGPPGCDHGDSARRRPSESGCQWAARRGRVPSYA